MEKANYYDYKQILKELDEKHMHRKINPTRINSILEIGCGEMAMKDKYTDYDVDYIGIDINPSMIEYARKKGREVLLENIVKPSREFMTLWEGKFGVVVANYVFTELKLEKLNDTFSNVSRLLTENGKFYFTITNPAIRGRDDLPRYKIEFLDENYKFNYRDLNVPFKVLLENCDGKYVDVGIVDYHNPKEIYEGLLSFDFETKVEEINYGYLGYPHALLFECLKR